MLLKYIVGDNKNLRSILKDELNISSRLFNKIKNKYVFVNGEHAIYYKDLNVNDVVEVDFGYADDNYNNIVSNPDIKFEIVYEDEWLLIVNKGANLPVHPSLNHYDISLSNGIRAYFDKIGLNKTVRLVNRIDKDTTGLVVIAKCEYIQECLIKQMNDDSFIKEYIAIARGLVDSSGVIDFPIARKDGSIIERCVDLVRGENAITNYVRLNLILVWLSVDCLLVELIKLECILLILGILFLGIVYMVLSVVGLVMRYVVDLVIIVYVVVLVIRMMLVICVRGYLVR